MRTTEIAVAAAILSACLAMTSARAEEPTITCDAAISGASTSNGPHLFGGASVCAEEGRHADANYLIVAGQIRTTADHAILKPVDEASTQQAFAVAILHQHIFGGLGSDEVYRSAAASTELEQRLRAFAPRFVTGYDPGWNYTQSSRTDVYDEVVAATREQHIWHMLSHSRRMQDDEYFAAYQALAELRGNQRSYLAPVGTPEAEKLDRLKRALSDAEQNIVDLPAPVIDMAFSID